MVGGCAYKNEPIALKPYEANYKTPISKNKQSILVKSVTDERIDKESIGYALKDGEKRVSFYSNEEFAKKYKDALIYALNIAEFNTATNQQDASATIEVRIKKIELIHKDKSFKENLKGEIAVELIVRRGSNITKHNFAQKAGKWMRPSLNSKNLEPFLAELFWGSIDAVVARLVE